MKFSVSVHRENDREQREEAKENLMNLVISKIPRNSYLLHFLPVFLEQHWKLQSENGLLLFSLLEVFELLWKKQNIKIIYIKIK